MKYLISIKRCYTALLLFFGTLSAIAQTYDANDKPVFKTVKDSTYHAHFEKLKSLYIGYLDSPEVKAATELLHNYKNKWRYAYDGDIKTLGKDQGGLNWISKNLHKTKFESFEAAKQEHYNVVQALTEAGKTKGNREYDDYNIKMMKIYGAQMYIDMYTEVRQQYPEKF